MFLQQLVNGLSIGSIYALMAVGYSLIYSLLNFSNFAHSITVAVGAYITLGFLLFIFQDINAAMIAAVILGGGIAMLIEIVAYHPLLKKNAKRIYLLIAGLGLSTIGENVLIIFSGGRFEGYPVTFPVNPIKIGGANIGSLDLTIMALSIVTLIIVELFIKKTRAGLAIRSAAFDLNTTALMGVNVQGLILIAFLIAGVLAGLAGTFLGAKYTVYPTIGAMTTKAFICSVLGGLGSIPGAMLGAITLGVTEAMIAGYLSSSLRDLFSFAVLVIVLIIRPTGFMGKVTDDKA
ncbi:branched-chain amino acid ABC transporter permease [Petroclostridium sp. X23]|uniref:branched-chain amino acid ABC transporter permease n=1 Tax=Petroclostridium sp. X23 TaxID=3045146 RepID=UPI0024ACBE4F|nr:branched-chain amino acid ABC transporter permease [Petroclostridium sp. X23]WHH61263.1 branched-chain amino acid ABC transporter permease [Petroclostridium sp. X23]